MTTHAFSFRHRGVGLPRWRAWLVLAVVLLAGGVAVLADRHAFTSRAQVQRPDLQRILDGLVGGWDRVTPGATAYVAGPRGVWSGSAGVATLGVAMRPDARLRLESVGKLWTATLVLKLVGERKMGLDDTVARWLPGLLPYGDRITVRQLLRMSSGMIDTNDFYARPLYYIGKIRDPAVRAQWLQLARRAAKTHGYPIPMQAWIQAAASLPLLYQPDTKWHYSNIGYMIVGLIAERAGGGDLATLFRSQIMDPLHLRSARYDPARNITGPHAHSYVIFPNGKLIDASTWTDGLGANGGIVSDAADEAHFLQALMRGRILQPAQLAALTTPYLANYALGTGVGPDGCGGAQTADSHNGGGNGYMSSVQVSPDGRRVAIVLINGYYSSQMAQDNTGETIRTAMQRMYCSG